MTRWRLTKVDEETTESFALIARKCDDAREVILLAAVFFLKNASCYYLSSYSSDRATRDHF